MSATAHQRPLVLGIETSCDDTACAVLDGTGRVLASIVSSQLAHRPYGGVVPEIASREHLASWLPVADAALEAAGIALADVDAVAATRGPGLVGSLLVGLSLGKAIAYARGVPFHPVHHLAGHLYSPFLAPPVAEDAGPDRTAEPAAPVPGRFVGLVVSGGHTSLYAVDGGAIETLGETRDDAMGEAFDKVGKRLGLPYPQGPKVDLLAELGDAEKHPFPVPTCGDSLDISYSGLKSQALLAIEKLEAAGVVEPRGREQEREGPWPEEVHHLFAGFREAAVAQLVDRLDRLADDSRGPLAGGDERPVLAVSGGAAANRLLRRRLGTWAASRGVDLRLVPLAYSGDNAAMIAHAALVAEQRGAAPFPGDPLAAEAASRIPLAG